MKQQLLTLIMFYCAFFGHSQTFTDNYITYEVISATTVSTTNYDTAGGTVVTIPSTVNYNSVTYDVTSIGYNSFFNKMLTSV